MFYSISNKSFQPIDPEEITSQIPVVGFLSLEELQKYAGFFGFSFNTIEELRADSHNVRSTIDDYEEFSFGILNIVDVGDIQGERDRIGLYLKKNLFLLVDAVDKDKSTRALFDAVLERFRGQQVSVGRVLYGFFERLIGNDNRSLETMEYQVTEMEEEVEAGITDADFNSNLLLLKKDLLLLRSYYEQLIDIGESLQENENHLFDSSALHYFKMFTEKVQRLSNETQQLRENLVQLREAYQASMDYSLNRIMKIFTVVTVIFLPLTLIVGWYGMNFTTMPELTWKYGYLSVIVLSVAVVITCLIFFKKKHFL